jgi:predicted nucleotidyltransferase
MNRYSDGVAKMDTSEVITLVKKYKKLLAQHMVFEKFILYGSYAKGNAHKNTDIDVAVVVDTASGDFFSTRPLLWKVRREIDDRIEPILVEKSHTIVAFYLK